MINIELAYRRTLEDKAHQEDSLKNKIDTGYYDANQLKE